MEEKVENTAKENWWGIAFFCCISMGRKGIVRDELKCIKKGMVQT